MRIGIIPALNRRRGGVYQYSLTMLHSLDELRSSGKCAHELVVFAGPGDYLALETLALSSWRVSPLPTPSWGKRVSNRFAQALGEGVHREAWRWLWRQMQARKVINPRVSDLDTVRFQPELRRWFDDCGVELMLYPSPLAQSFETGIPYVMAIHDLQHRFHPEFPEVSSNGEWEYREYLYRNASRYATLILADSEVGKEDILNVYWEYGITPDRVKVLPFLPAPYLAEDVSVHELRRVRKSYGLPELYLFYPAHFWPHKNHCRIVEALGLLKQEHRLEVPIVFCGTHAGRIRQHTYKEIFSLARQLDMEDQILHIGYVPDDDMSALYAGAVALVMPTFFGPTNIPVLEAWAFGCPVLTSDIRGIREQVGDAAVLVEPSSVDHIADGIYRLLQEEDLRQILVVRGRERLAQYTPHDYRQRLLEILKQAESLLVSKAPSYSGLKE